MPMLRWDTPERRRALLCELVSWESGTGSPGEARFPFRLAERLRELPMFVGRAELVTPSGGDDAAVFATALYRNEHVVDTIVLISHYDTVGTVEYGTLQHYACEPERLTEALRDHLDQLDPAAAADARSGDYLFGRGTADMKAGLALHMALIERAAAEGWPINLLLLAVGDEENSSAGMRAAVTRLEELSAEHGLRYVLFLNSEPSLPTQPGDERQHVYSGTIGKLLPSALCVGRGTHASTPLAGMTSTYVAGWLSLEMEWSRAFHEQVHGEPTPLPVTLWQRDLREGYSTQTTSRTSVLYNVFVMQQSAAEVLARFEQVARRAADSCNHAYREVCLREGIEPIGSVDVLRFDELVAHVVERFGAEATERVMAEASSRHHQDLAEQAIHVADALLVMCPELAPAVVLLFAPPYYPPVDSWDDPLVRMCMERVRTRAARDFGREVAHQHWFTALSDLSYVNHRGSPAGWVTYERSTPAYGQAYEIPFAAMSRLRAPVLNVGPRGKDLHMWTERLDCRSAFEELPELLADLVRAVAAERATSPAAT